MARSREDRRREALSLRDAWDAQAAEWTRFARDPDGDRANLDFNIPCFFELVPGPGRATLDLGCGEGRVGAALARLGHRVLGVDSSPGMVEAARELIPAEVADARALPFEDGSFDLVVAFMSLQDMDDLGRAALEAGRVLEPGGRLCFAVPHPINLSGRFTRKEADAPFVIAGSYLEPRRHEELVERDGYRIRFAAIHRPLEGYSRALEAAGLLIEALREPVRHAHPCWSRVPLVLHVRAVKP